MLRRFPTCYLQQQNASLLLMGVLLGCGEPAPGHTRTPPDTKRAVATFSQPSDTAGLALQRVQASIAALRELRDVLERDLDLSICSTSNVSRRAVADSLRRWLYTAPPALLECDAPASDTKGKLKITATSCTNQRCTVSGRYFRGNTSWRFEASTFPTAGGSYHWVAQVGLSGKMTVD